MKKIDFIEKKGSTRKISKKKNMKEQTTQIW